MIVKSEKSKKKIIDKKCVLCGNSFYKFILKTEDKKEKKEYKLVECINCGLGHILPFPRNIEKFYSDDEYYAYNDLKKSEGGSYYDKLLAKIGRYSISRTFKERQKGTKNIIKEIAFKTVSHRFSGQRFLDSRYRKYKPNKILDIGTGGGMFLDEMRLLGWKTYGVDISALAVEQLKKRGFNAFYGELEQSNFANDFFDVVRASYVIEHVRNPLTFLREIRRILKPGGTAIICLPKYDSFQAKFFLENWGILSIPQHTYHFKYSNIEGLVNKAGLKLAYKRFYSGGSFVPSLRNLMQSKGVDPFFLKLIDNHLLTFLSIILERFLVFLPFYCDAMEVYIEKD